LIKNETEEFYFLHDWDTASIEEKLKIQL